VGAVSGCYGQGIKWTSHFRLMLKVRIHAALPFLPHTYSWYVVLSMWTAYLPHHHHCCCHCFHSYNKPTRCTDFSNLFWIKTVCFGQFLCPSSGVLHCAHSNGICHTSFADSLRAGTGCSILILLCVRCRTPDDGQRNCPKHVEF